jgi:hypothetical protein
MIIRQAEVLYQFSRSVSILVFKNENENEIKSHFDNLKNFRADI